MGKKTTIFCYQHKEFIEVASSVNKAAKLSNLSTYLVNTILNDQTKCSKQGWFFSFEKIEDVNKIPDKKEEKTNTLQRVNDNKLAKVVGKQVYEVQHNNGLVTDIPRSHEERKLRLKQLVAALCKDRWMKISQSRVALERQGLKELIDSL